MLEADLFQHLRTWTLKAVDGQVTDVIDAFPAASPPVGPYIAFNLIDGGPDRVWPTQMNYEEDPIAEQDSIKNLYQVPAMLWEWRYSVHVMAPHPLDLARQITSWAVSDAADLLLYPLIVLPITRVRRIPEWIDGKWEGRAQFDMLIHGYIQDGKFLDEDGNTVFLGRVPTDEILQGTISVSPVDVPDLVLTTDYQRPTEE